MSVQSDVSATAIPIKKEIISKPNQVSTVVLYGVPIVALIIENQERLCLAQISNTLLKQFSYNEIHNRRVALGITCVQCTPVQLEILRRAGAMPVSSRRCGMITRREAERLCKSFLGDNDPPRLPDDFAFAVFHECAWGCRGSFLPSRYNSSRAKCIKCLICGLFFSPNKFIFHSHRLTSNDKYVQPDAANFNSWRRHMKLSGNPPEEIVHAWEDVKAMFNGGTRKRLLSSSAVSHSLKQHVSKPQNQPVVPSPRLASCQELPLPLSRVAMDLIYYKPLGFSSYSSLPWLKGAPLIFPQESPLYPLEKSYQSAFKPVQPIVKNCSSKMSDDSDHEVDIETTDDNAESTGNWDMEEKKIRESSKSPQVNVTTSRDIHSPFSQNRNWNVTKLSMDVSSRETFLNRRQDVQSQFLIGENGETGLSLRKPGCMEIGLNLTSSYNACSTQSGTAYSIPETENKVT
ncbi:SKI family transcriptional corepressor 1 homolog-B isoform X2 [Euwallacea fornicatus]|uniref:SKI family transcriptional corepressor 1 homolog-B isoform X2 n=1 Tax=Euwallacea fornicatus TaxID=995702 RepID=UPI0033901182